MSGMITSLRPVHDALVLELVGEPVEAPRVVARDQLGFVRLDLERGRGRGCAEGKATADGLVQDLFEALAIAMHRVVDETSDVRIERDGRSHGRIMMHGAASVKMRARVARWERGQSSPMLVRRSGSSRWAGQETET